VSNYLHNFLPVVNGVPGSGISRRCGSRGAKLWSAAACCRFPPSELARENFDRERHSPPASKCSADLFWRSAAFRASPRSGRKTVAHGARSWGKKQSHAKTPRRKDSQTTTSLFSLRPLRLCASARYAFARPRIISHLPVEVCGSSCEKSQISTAGATFGYGSGNKRKIRRPKCGGLRPADLLSQELSEEWIH